MDIDIFDCSAAEEELFGPKDRFKSFEHYSARSHRNKTYRLVIDGYEMSVTGTGHMLVAGILMLCRKKPSDCFFIWQKTDAWWSLGPQWPCLFHRGEVERYRTVPKGEGQKRKVLLPDPVLARLNSQAGVDYSLHYEEHRGGKIQAAIYRPLPHPPPPTKPKLFPEWDPVALGL